MDNELLDSLRKERKELLQQMRELQTRVNEIEDLVTPHNIKEHAKSKLTPEERKLLGLD